MIIGNTKNCHFCGSAIKREGSSLHAWDIEYDCGLRIFGAIDTKTHGEEVLIDKICTMNVDKTLTISSPKQEAISLFNQYFSAIKGYGPTERQQAKINAAICINAIIKSRADDGAFDDTLSSTASEYYTPHPMYLTYWLLVKQEIEKL